MSDRTDPMQKPNWWSNNITLGNAILLLTIVFGAGAAWQQIDSFRTTQEAHLAGMEAAQSAWRTERDKQDEVRRVSLDAVLASLTTKVQPIDSMAYRIGQAEGNITAVNSRVDRVVDAMQRAVDPLSDKISTLTTRVEVLAVAIDRISPTIPGRRSDNEPNDGKQVLR